jgi:hypothetical protein
MSTECQVHYGRIDYRESRAFESQYRANPQRGGRACDGTGYDKADTENPNSSPRRPSLRRISYSIHPFSSWEEP